MNAYFALGELHIVISLNENLIQQYKRLFRC